MLRYFIEHFVVSVTEFLIAIGVSISCTNMLLSKSLRNTSQDIYSIAKKNYWHLIVLFYYKYLLIHIYMIIVHLLDPLLYICPCLFLAFLASSTHLLTLSTHLASGPILSHSVLGSYSVSALLHLSSPHLDSSAQFFLFWNSFVQCLAVLE